MAGLNISPVNVLSLTRSYQLITYLPILLLYIYVLLVRDTMRVVVNLFIGSRYLLWVERESSSREYRKSLGQTEGGVCR